MGRQGSYSLNVVGNRTLAQTPQMQPVNEHHAKRTHPTPPVLKGKTRNWRQSTCGRGRAMAAACFDGHAGMCVSSVGYATDPKPRRKGMLSAPKDSGVSIVPAVKELRGLGQSPSHGRNVTSAGGRMGQAWHFRGTPLHDEAVLMLHMCSVEGKAAAERLCSTRSSAPPHNPTSPPQKVRTMYRYPHKVRNSTNLKVRTMHLCPSFG